MPKTTDVTALILNPNTTQDVTRRLLDKIKAAMPLAQSDGRSGGRAPGRTLASSRRLSIHLRGATARFGAAYIASEAGYAVAGHATLDTWARAQRTGPVDAVVVGCFGDPGLAGLAELTAVPVIGLAEAAVAEAASRGRFAIVTGGAAWRPMLQRIVAGMPAGHQLDDVVVIRASGGALANDPDRALRLLATACRRAARPGVQSVVLGGAGFAGMGDQLADVVPVPVIDSVSAAARALVRRLDGQPPTRRAADGAVPSPTVFKGLAPTLLARLNPS